MDDEDEVTVQITNNLAVNFTEPGAILKKGIKFQNEKEFDEYMSTDSLITTLVTTSISNSSKFKQYFDEKNSENEKLSEYEKIRLRNIAERKKMFQELNLNQLKKNVAILPIQKAFKCIICGQTFPKEILKKEHFISVHVGKRPKSSREKKMIKKFSHDNFQSLKCPECNFIALRQSGLTQHRKRKHKICTNQKKISQPIQDMESSAKKTTSAGNNGGFPTIQFTNLANINEAIGKLLDYILKENSQ